MVQLATAPESVVSHWHQLLEGVQATPSAFYSSVEEALRERGVPDLTISRVEYREAGFASAHRQYLHIARGHLVFDICAASFGKGCFVSSWLAETRPTLPAWFRLLVIVLMIVGFFGSIYEFGLVEGLFVFAALIFGALAVVKLNADSGPWMVDFVSALPLIGLAYTWLFTAPTYYAHDTTLMFQEAVQNSLMQAVDGLTSQQGLRALTEAERRPVQKDFFRRRAA